MRKIKDSVFTLWLPSRLKDNTISVFLCNERRGRRYISDLGWLLDGREDSISNDMYKEIYKICKDNDVLFVDYEIRTRNFSASFTEELDKIEKALQQIENILYADLEDDFFEQEKKESS